MSYRLVLPVLTALAVLSSCQKEEQAGEASRQRISFNCQPVVDVTTRAHASLIKGIEPVPGQKFGVYAWNTGASPLSANPGAPGFITDLAVTFANNNDQGKNNSYTPLIPDNMSDLMDQYWPRPTDPGYAVYDYSFAAYYPIVAGGAITPSFGTANTVGVYSFNTPSTAASMVDFCVSDIANDQVYGHTNTAWDGTVGLTFHHMLTRVQIKFVKARDVASDFDIHIVDAKLEDVLSTGTLTATYIPDIDDTDPGNVLIYPGTTEFTWSGKANYRDYEITIGGVNPGPYDPDDPPANLDGLTLVSLGWESGSTDADVFLLIPQDMLPRPTPGSSAKAHAIHFWWTAEDSDTVMDTILYLDECVTGIGVETPANIDWGRNQFVTYNVVIRAKPIEFDLEASIKAWDDEEGYYSIVD